MQTEQQNSDLGALLSAYLDGELSAAQVQKVEKLLGQSPEARQMLDQMRQVSKQVQRLPRERAPHNLLGMVQRDLEREVLLGQADAVAQLTGQKHLAWRRFIAAAALLVLCGSIVTIIYRVMFYTPAAHFPPSVSPSKQTAPAAPSEKNRGASRSVLPFNKRQVSELAAAHADGAHEPSSESSFSYSTPSTLGKEAARPERFTPPPASTMLPPRYQMLKLELHSEQPGQDQRILEAFLTQHHISKPIKHTGLPHRVRYIFFCGRDQMEALIGSLNRQLPVAVATLSDAAAQEPPQSAKAVSLAESTVGSKLTANEDTLAQSVPMPKPSDENAGLADQDTSETAQTAKAKALPTPSIAELSKSEPAAASPEDVVADPCERASASDEPPLALSRLADTLGHAEPADYVAVIFDLYGPAQPTAPSTDTTALPSSELIPSSEHPTGVQE